MSLFHVETTGVEETKAAFDELRTDLAAPTRGTLRAASVSTSTELAGVLRAAGAGAAPPVAKLVARSVQPKAGGWPGVSIGGTLPVGRYGAIAAKLLWGSEHGPAGEPNHFAVGPNSAGYWIAPTVKAFRESAAMTRFSKAIDVLVAKVKLN